MIGICLAFGDVQVCGFRDIEKILTEDLNHGQIIEGVLIENLFFVVGSSSKVFEAGLP